MKLDDFPAEIQEAIKSLVYYQIKHIAETTEYYNIDNIESNLNVTVAYISNYETSISVKFRKKENGN